MATPLEKTALAVNPITAGPFAAASMFGGGSGRDKQKDFAVRAADQHQPGNPYWQQQGGDADSHSWAYDGFYRSFGRAPTADELAQLVPAYKGSDPNITNVAAGDAMVAQMHQATENTPDKLYSKQQAEYKANAPKFYDQVNGLISGQLGRAASQDELDHFGSLLASGTTDSYQLTDFLKQQPEYQTRQNEQMRTGLSGTMAANDRRQFSEQILPSIQEAYAKQGRSFDSSAFANSATQSAQAQNTNREGFLNNLTAQQYGGVQDRAYQDYANQVAQQQNLTNSGIQAQYGQIQNVQNRSNQFTDFNIQNQMYQQYLAKYGKRNNGLGGALVGVAGGLLGAKLGGAEGAQAGFAMGNALGTAGQNMYGGSY